MSAKCRKRLIILGALWAQKGSGARLDMRVCFFQGPLYDACATKLMATNTEARCAWQGRGGGEQKWRRSRLCEREPPR